jgi:hypothetical protein
MRARPGGSGQASPGLPGGAGAAARVSTVVPAGQGPGAPAGRPAALALALRLALAALALASTGTGCTKLLAPSETRVSVFKGKFGVNDRVQPCFVKLTDLTRSSNLHSR